MVPVALAIHGGSGAFASAPGSDAREGAMRREMEAIVRDGTAALRAEQSALDVVEAAVRRMEDCELFNAGRGSALTRDGRVEMDAAVMDGAGRRAGAVACVAGLAHPVSAARAVLERSPHVLLVAAGAEAFAAEAGLARVDPDSLVSAERRRAFDRDRHAKLAPTDDGCRGTVGAVARDVRGHLAAATSTGGMTGQLPGRVGDSPLLGAGTWADDSSCAVSATGHGELLIRCAVAHEIDAALRHAGRDLEAACRAALGPLPALGGDGGCIAVDRRGALALVWNSGGMARAWLDDRGQVRSGIR